MKPLRFDSAARAELLHEIREELYEVVLYAVRPDAREPGYWLKRTQ